MGKEEIVCDLIYQDAICREKSSFLPDLNWGLEIFFQLKNLYALPELRCVG